MISRSIRRASCLLLATLVLGSLVATRVAAQDSKPSPLPATSAESRRSDDILKALEVIGGMTSADWKLVLDAKAARARELIERATAMEKEATTLSEGAATLRREAAVVLDEQRRIEALRGRLAPETTDPQGTAAKDGNVAAMSEPPSVDPATAQASAVGTSTAAPSKAEPADLAANDPKTVDAKAVDAKTAPSAPAGADGDLVTFDDHVRPIFEASCTSCHGGDAADGGLDLSEHRLILRGGSSGVVLKPGDARTSRLYRVLTRAETPYMPKNASPLTDPELETIKKWIDGGAPADLASARRMRDSRKSEEAAPRAAPRRTVEKGPAKKGEVLLPPAITIDGGGRSPVLSLAALPGDGGLLVGDRSGIRRVDVAGNLSPSGFEFPFGAVQALDVSRDGALLLAAGGTAGSRGGAVLYDLATKAVLRRFDVSSDACLAAAISPGKTLLAIGGTDRRVHVYLASTGEKLYDVKDTKDWVYAVQFSPDGNFLASGDRSGGLYLHLADSGRQHAVLEGHEGAVNGLAFRPDAGALASVGDDGVLHFFELEDGKETRRVDTKDDDALAVRWQDETRLLTAGSGGTIRLWEAGGNALGATAAFGEWIQSLATWSASPRIAAGLWNGRIVWMDEPSSEAQRGP